jgi:acetyl-CoA carboxylase carboxyl transferase subunit alpha
MSTHQIHGLEFEKPIAELERKIQDLRTFVVDKKIDLSSEIKRLEEKLESLKRQTYGALTPWQRVQIARHPQRPYTLDYIGMLTTDFYQIHGDRAFADDKAIVGGFATFEGRKVMVMGHQKGRDTKENLRRNFGCAHPEGYRKALRLMQMAEKFDLPVVIFIDTPGAYPGIGAEERGQAHAIAVNLREMMRIATPMVAFVIGEGGSGGALGIGVTDKVYVLENAYYSVISPEGCAAILWKDGSKAPLAAEALKLTAPDLIGMNLIDGMVEESLGGAHRKPQVAAERMRELLKSDLAQLCRLEKEELLSSRYDKFRGMGRVA